MSMPLFQAPPAQSFNALVVWLPETKTEQLQVDVGQSVQWCFPRADVTCETGDTVRVSRVGQTYVLDGLVSKAPKAEPDTPTDSATDSSSTGATP